MRARLREPVTIPRWALTGKYGFFLLLAALSFFRGMTTLDLTTPESYLPLWAGAVGLGAAVAVPSSLSPKTEFVERWAAAWIAGWLSVVAVNSFLINSGSGWLFIVLVTLLPAGRALSLFSKRPAK
jgi:hypothetical protein